MPLQMNSYLIKLSNLLFTCFLISGCSTSREVYSRNPLVKQIIKPRPGFEGKLTNSRCVKYEKDECKKLEYQSYDLNDESVRLNLNGHEFICSINGKRYKICKDKPGFCRHWYTGWFVFKEKHEEYLPIAKYQFILDSGAKCFSRKIYGRFK